MYRRTTRFLGAVLLVTAAAVGLTSVANAGTVRVAGSLLGAGRELTVADCSHTFDGDAVAVVPKDRFDRGTTAFVSASDRSGWASGGGATGIATAALVHVHVPAGTAAGVYPVDVKAAGMLHGKPAEVIDRLTVRVRCSAR
ncbi:MAG: hypothetical protein JWN29_170 [Acidimicrobiales bacterium]|nr:hypothetical protein [Acidimicrobiales bacterium]